MRKFESEPVRLDEKATLTSGQHPPWDTFTLLQEVQEVLLTLNIILVLSFL